MGSGSRKSQKELRQRMEAALDAFKDESDRACPLIGQEWINDALGELLYAVFASNGANADVHTGLLNGASAPIGTF